MDTGTATIDPDPMNTDHSHETEGALPPPFAPPLPPPKIPWWRVPVARDQDNKKIGGVVAGLSRAYGFDVKTTRIAVAIVTLVIPAVIVLYIAAMILLPDHPSQAMPLGDVVTDRRKMPLAIALGVVLVLASVGSFGSWFVFGGFGWGFALIALGIVLWAAPNLSSKTATSTATATTNPVGPPPPAPFAAPATQAPTAPITTVYAPPPQPVEPRRRRFPVLAISFLVASSVAIVSAIGDALDWWNTNVLAVTVSVLLILIVGGFVSTIVNRSWLGLAFALMWIPLTVGLLVTQPNLNGGIGERTVTPTTITEFDTDQSLGIGRLTLDLTDLPDSEQTIAASADVGLGQLRVIVPASTQIALTTKVGAGVVTVDGTDITSGLRHGDEQTIKPTSDLDASPRTIALDLEVGAGQILIEHATP